MQDYGKYIVKSTFSIFHSGDYKTFQKGDIVKISPLLYKAEYIEIAWYVGVFSNVHIDQFRQILPYLEKVSKSENSHKEVKGGEDDHAGMIYNPITDSWSWL